MAVHRGQLDPSRAAEMTYAERTRSLQDLGYNKREAAFLCLAALHSGYFLRRQYQVFAGYRGGVEERLLERAESSGHVRATIYANRTEVYHVFARAVYRAIGEEDNRNRRPRPTFSIKAKLMALDFVLAHPSVQFLATESEKLEYFWRERGIDRSILPAKMYSGGPSSESTRRYFIEKYPIFVVDNEPSAARLPSFCYVDEGVLSNSGFTRFLNRYRQLFVTLRRFRLIYIASEHTPFRRAQRAFELFAEGVTNPEAQAPRGAIGEYFRLRRLLETRRYQQLDKSRLDRLRDLSQRFRHHGTESHFQQWAEEVGVHARFGPVEARFEHYRLCQSYDIFGTEPRRNSAAQNGAPDCSRCSAPEPETNQ